MASVLRSLRAPLRALPRPSIASARLAPFSTTALRAAGHGPAPPQLYGPGGKAGEVPTDEQQATGIERFELLGDLYGIDVFDMKPLEMTRIGTLDDPIKVFSWLPERIVGCTGFPADSHDTIWLRMDDKLEKHRCPECGSVYKLDVPAMKADGHHHHHSAEEGH